MNYKELAIRIASAEDPYGEFAKEAEQLDEIHKTALTREVNKQFFLSRVANKNSDGDISFDVIDPEIKGTHDTEGISDGDGMSKTASDNSEVATSKRDLVDDSMFIVKVASRETTGTFKAKSVNNKLTHEFADYAIEKNASQKKFEESRDKANMTARAIAELNDYRGNLIDKIANEANDASELRTIIKMALDYGSEDIIGDIVASSRETESDLMKVASTAIDLSSTRNISKYIEQAGYASEWIGIIKEASEDSSIDKEAFINMLGTIGLAGAKALGTVGKKAFGAGKWAAKKTMTPAGMIVAPTVLAAPAVFSARSDRTMKSAM
jgi:hypothetical protein